MIAWLDRRFPRLAFARKVPPQRVVMRIIRRLEHRIGLDRRRRSPRAALRAAHSWPTARFPARQHAVKRTAEGWEFAFLGVGQTFGQRIDWHPVGAGIGQLWRMNLHYFEYLESLDAEDGTAAIEQWIGANPPGTREAYEAGWNAYALSLRIVCWLQWLGQHAAALGPDTVAGIGRSIAEQADYLARFPETDIGGNHLVKNIKALAWASACFEGRDADRWRALASALLHRELGDQVLADGFHFELSPSYHCQVAADLIETRAAAPDIDPRIDDAINRMVIAAAVLAHPDGRVAQFNDAGLSMAYTPAELAAAGGEAVTAKAPKPSCAILREGGLASLRSDRLSTFVKFGRLGPATLPAHAHGDIGTFELSAGPDRVIVDQGVFEYVDGPRRKASRAASSHNVTAPADAGMADFFGAFRCGWMPNPRIESVRCADGELSVEVEHDGFTPASGTKPIAISRRIAATPNRLKIIDRVRGPHSHLDGWATRFLLHPDWHAVESGGAWVLSGPGDRTLTIRSDASGMVQPAEWWPDMGVSVHTQRLIFTWEPGRTAIEITIEQG